MEVVYVDGVFDSLAATVTYDFAINPYSNVNGTISGLPSGQYLYVAEAVSTAFTLPPFITTPTIYSYGIF